MSQLAKTWVLWSIVVLALLGTGYLTNRNTRMGLSCGPSDCSVAKLQSLANQATVPPHRSAANLNVVQAKGLPKLADYGSTTCMPCKMMKPILEGLSSDYKGLLVVDFVDVSKNREAAEKQRIQVIPTQVFIDDKGTEFFRHEGFYSKDEILAKFREHGIVLSRGS